VIVKVELLLGGVACSSCSLKELAVVVADFLTASMSCQCGVSVQWLVLSIVSFLDVTLLGVIATIG